MEYGPWWLWPNLLSLDAPLIAVLWQAFLSRSVARVDAVETVVLGLSVWLVYMSDRVLDTLGEATGREAPRHRFARRHRRLLMGVGIPVLALDAGLAVAYLPVGHLAAGLGLVAAVAGRYVAGRWGWPKDFWTGVVFASGVWAPLLLANLARPGVVVFALLCWWNCAAIDSWESGRGRPMGRFAVGLMALAAGLFVWTGRPVALAEGMTAAGFCVLAAGGRRWGPNGLRVAVDACLLTPLVVHVRGF